MECLGVIWPVSFPSKRFSSIAFAYGMFVSFVVLALRPVGHQALRAYARISPPGDRLVFDRPEIESMFIDDLTDTGGRLRAAVDDVILFTRDWGFSLRNIRVPVKWWHGDSDNIVPLSHGEHCVALIPDVELFIRPGESHLGGFGAAEEVLDTILAAWARRSSVGRAQSGSKTGTNTSPSASNRT